LTPADDRTIERSARRQPAWVDLTRILAGPLCTMMLGDMGAEIIKVEPARPAAMTPGAWGPPFVGRRGRPISWV